MNTSVLTIEVKAAEVQAGMVVGDQLLNGGQNCRKVSSVESDRFTHIRYEDGGYEVVGRYVEIPCLAEVESPHSILREGQIRQ